MARTKRHLEANDAKKVKKTRVEISDRPHKSTITAKNPKVKRFGSPSPDDSLTANEYLLSTPSTHASKTKARNNEDRAFRRELATSEDERKSLPSAQGEEGFLNGIYSFVTLA